MWDLERMRRVNNVGIHDKFFDLGGHSILAARVIGRIKYELNADISLRQLFDAPTVVQLALHVHQRGDRNESTPPSRIDRTAFKALPLSLAQERLWFLEQLEPETATYHVPIAIRVRGKLDVEIT